MSNHTQLVIATGIGVILSAGTAAFLCWLLWSLFWDAYDHFMQQRTRRRMNNLQPRSSRDCFRDMKGTTR